MKEMEEIKILIIGDIKENIYLLEDCFNYR